MVEWQNYPYFCIKATIMSIFFFRRPKPKQFNYIPRYYDPVKEEREARKRELGLMGEGDLKARMRADIHRKWRVERSPAARQVFWVRAVIYAVIIGLFLYFIFFSDFINKFISFFFK
jgi:hypothetical protein